MVERVAPILGTERNSVGIDRAVALVPHRLCLGFEAEHRYRTRDAVRDQQAVDRRPRQSRCREVGVGIAPAEVTITERLPGPSGSWFVDRVEAHYIGQIEGAARCF